MTIRVRRGRAVHGAWPVLALASVVGLTDAAPGDSTLVSVRQAGLATAMGASSTARVSANVGCAVSADGRFVAFAPRATNLVPGDTNAADDVFVRDLVSGTIERVSLASSGLQSSSAIGRRA
jgi:hypothetical protein